MNSFFQNCIIREISTYYVERKILLFLDKYLILDLLVIHFLLVFLRFLYEIKTKRIRYSTFSYIQKTIISYSKFVQFTFVFLNFFLQFCHQIINLRYLLILFNINIYYINIKLPLYYIYQNIK